MSCKNRDRLLSPHNSIPVFRYIYEGNITSISPEPSLGAYHSSELPLLFGTWDNFRSELNSPETRKLAEETSHAMQDAWVAFAKDGAKGLEATRWPRYTDGGSLTKKDVRVFAAAPGIPVSDENEGKMEGSCPERAEELG